MAQIIIETPAQIAELEGKRVHLLRVKERLARGSGKPTGETSTIIDNDGSVVNGRFRADGGRGRPGNVRVGDVVEVLPEPVQE